MSDTGSARPEVPVRVGIDIGGTGTRFVALGPDGSVVARRSISTPAVPMSAEEAGVWFADAVGALVAGGPGGDPLGIAAVGVGVSGPVLPGGVVDNPHTLAAFSGLRLEAVLTDALRVPVTVESDAVAAALAEASSGAGVGATTLVHVTLGTGIGVAVVRNGLPVLGSDGLAPEAGHLDVPESEGPACYCGRTRCWEQEASRRALQRRSGIADVAGLDALARSGASPARAVLDGYGRAVGLGLRNLAQVLRPDRIVIGGGGARWFASYEPALRAALDEVDLHGLCVDVRATTLDDDGGAIGAALLGAHIA